MARPSRVLGRAERSGEDGGTRASLDPPLVEVAQFRKPHAHVAGSCSNSAVERIALRLGSIAHVLVDLPGQTYQGQIQPCGGKGGGQLVGKTQLRHGPPGSLCVAAGVEQSELAPLWRRTTRASGALLAPGGVRRLTRPCPRSRCTQCRAGRRQTTAAGQAGRHTALSTQWRP